MPGLLKRASPSTPAVVPRALLEARASAETLVAAARAEAARLLAEAAAERDALLAAAVEAGRREGRAAAAADLARVAEVRRERLEALEPELARTALEVARAVVRREVAAHGPEVVLALARGALELARARREVVLRVSPDDAAEVRAQAGALSALLQRCPALALQEDPALAPGDAVVETEAGRIDARIEAQLAALRRALEEGEPCTTG